MFIWKLLIISGNKKRLLICIEIKTRESPFTPNLHGFAQLNFRLLEWTICELFVKVPRVSVPIQLRNKWRSDRALKSLTSGCLANFLDLLDSWPISPQEEKMILHTVRTLSSQPLLWILGTLVTMAIMFPPLSKIPAQPLDILLTTPESEGRSAQGITVIPYQLGMWLPSLLCPWRAHSDFHRGTGFCQPAWHKAQYQGPTYHHVSTHLFKDQKATNPRPLYMEDTAAILGPRNWACRTKSMLCLVDASPDPKIWENPNFTFLQTPKSVSLTWPSLVSITLSGFRSLCTMPFQGE